MTQTLLGMDYIKVKTIDKKVSIEFSQEMWIFLLLTFTLLVLTTGSYSIWKRKGKRREMAGLGGLV